MIEHRDKEGSSFMAAYGACHIVQCSSELPFSLHMRVFLCSVFAHSPWEMGELH